MSRSSGARNAKYEDKKQAILQSLWPLLSGQEGDSVGMRALAKSAGVSVATLQHYFTNKQGIILAVLALIGDQGGMWLERARVPGVTFTASMSELAYFLMTGFAQPPVQAAHLIGLREGPADGTIAHAYLNDILEPSLQAVESRLIAHMERGDMREVDARVAALAFVAPLFLAHMHQGPLCGADVRALDERSFITAHVDGFCTAYRV